MGATKDAYMHDVEAANDAASVVSDEIAATNGFRLPPFERAIVVPEELPEMPAEIVEGILLETHKTLLTGPSKANKTWGLINLAVSVATGGCGWMARPGASMLWCGRTSLWLACAPCMPSRRSASFWTTSSRKPSW